MFFDNEDLLALRKLFEEVEKLIDNAENCRGLSWMDGSIGKACESPPPPPRVISSITSWTRFLNFYIFSFLIDVTHLCYKVMTLKKSVNVDAFTPKYKLIDGLTHLSWRYSKNTEAWSSLLSSGCWISKLVYLLVYRRIWQEHPRRHCEGQTACPVQERKI